MDKLFAPPPQLNMEATNFKEEWELFEQGFDLFITATDSTDKPEPTRVAMFLSAIGADARRVFSSFTFAAEADKKKLDKVKDKFRDYRTPRKNEVFERYKFFELSQASGESIDSFAAVLRLREKDCGFGDQTESLIRDRIVFGCSDARVKERLLREDNLTLKSALDICRAAEVSKAQMKVMKSESVSSSSSVAAATVSGRYTSRRPPSTSSDPCCRQCGSPPHDAQQTCPAKNQTCRRCGKSNHFARMCRSKPPPAQQQQQSSHQQRRRSRSPSRRGRDRDASVNVVADGVSDLDISDCFIGVGATSNVDDAERSWWETVLVNNSPVGCKLDSGAEGNVMSVGTFNELKESSKLRPTKVRLFDFSNRRSDPLGVATLTVRHKDRELQLDFFIVDGSGPTLLSCLTCSKLNLLQHVDSSLQSKPPTIKPDLCRT